MTKTFICDISSAFLSEAIIESLPKSRIEYVNSITDANRKRQSVFAFRLLQHVLKDKKTEFIVKDGKWQLADNSVFFSISHSGNFVAVAIDNVPVGVDIEKCSDKILKLSRKLTEEENVNIFCLTRLWTEKESRFKCGYDFMFSSEFVSDKEGNDYSITTCSKNNAVLITVDINDIL